MKYDQMKEEISNIGFGCYRISQRSKEHFAALDLAIERGCTLIDTSANYTDGDSEKLVGEIVHKHAKKKLFIVTKAGYIQGQNFKNLEKLQQMGKGGDDLVTVSEDLFHSIHPDFLQDQIEQSLLRMQLPTINCFLLHNPEYYFKSKHDTNLGSVVYYQRIKKAMEFLEEKVHQGLIQSYGISSNNFPYAPDQIDATNIKNIISLAQQVSSQHHFRMIQFPFNLLEEGAALPYYDGQSLIDVCQQNQIFTLSNRPLNAFDQGQFTRLATYPESELSGEDIADVFSVCQQKMQNRWDHYQKSEASSSLKDQGEEENLWEIPLIKQFCEIWNNLPTPDAVDQVFHLHFFPFLARLWGGKGLDQHDAKPFFVLYETALALARKNMNQRAMILRHQLMQEKKLSDSPEKSFSQLVCQHYLAKGIDCVLVGMKKKSYVLDLQNLF